MSKLTKTKKTEVVKTPALPMQSPEASRSVAYSIARIIEFVNCENSLRYIAALLFCNNKGTAPRTLLAGVTENSATIPNNSISENSKKSKTFDEKISEKFCD